MPQQVQKKSNVLVMPKQNKRQRVQPLIKWDDESPYEWIRYFGERNKKKLPELKVKCEKLIKERRLKYKTIHISRILRKNYKIHTVRLLHHAKRFNQGKSFGTFFCRPKRGGNWFLKDGNHRFMVLVINGVKRIRFAYDPKNRI